MFPPSNRPPVHCRPSPLTSGIPPLLLLFADLDLLLAGIISCDGFTKYSGSFSEDYCWTQGLYTIKEAYDLLLMNVPYPGTVPGMNVVSRDYRYFVT